MLESPCRGLVGADGEVEHGVPLFQTGEPARELVDRLLEQAARWSGRWRCAFHIADAAEC
jgi:hypothetical protein